MPSSDHRATRLICSTLLASRRLSSVVLGPCRSTVISKGRVSRLQKRAECGVKAGSSRNSSSQACHETDEIASVVQLLVVDGPIALRVRGSFNAEDRAALLHA